MLLGPKITELVRDYLFCQLLSESNVCLLAQGVKLSIAQQKCVKADVMS